jgi:hypothetical protein
MTYVLTHWPGRPSAPPRLIVPQVRLVDDEVLLFGTDLYEADNVREVAVPEEAYLREFGDLDTTNANEVLRFCTRYGPVGESPPSDLPDEVRKNMLIRAENGDDTFEPLSPWDSRESLARAGYSPDGLLMMEHFAEPLPMRSFWRVQKVSTVRLYQSVLSDLVQLWEVISEGADPVGRLGGWHSEFWSPPEAKDVAAHGEDPVSKLMAGLNPALSAFHVYLEGEEERLCDNVYAVLCLQLANHIAERAVYRRCAAAGCGQRFVRKLGRERHGNRVRGALHFCSDKCANRQAQSDHRALNRRLAKEAVALHERGLSTSDIAVRLSRTERQVDKWIGRKGDRTDERIGGP